MHLSNRSVLISMLLVCLGLSVNAPALESDRKQPINVEADRASFNKKTGTSTYNGNVVVEQGSMRISADVLKVYARDGKLHKMLAQGKPVKFQQRVDKANKDISAVAEKMIFDGQKNVIIFEQAAELRQGANSFSSNRIVYNLDEDTVDAGKKSGGGRVTIIIQPSDEGSTR